MQYINDILERVARKNPAQPEFHQAVREVLESLEPVLEANPDYQPWFEPFFQPESGEVESGLFALQAALGGSVLGFAIGALWGRRRGEQVVSAAGPAGPASDAVA